MEHEKQRPRKPSRKVHQLLELMMLRENGEALLDAIIARIRWEAILAALTRRSHYCAISSTAIGGDQMRQPSTATY